VALFFLKIYALARFWFFPYLVMPPWHIRLIKWAVLAVMVATIQTTST
jgi:hypothetical protein